MTWLRIDDRFTEHPKVVGLPDGAFRLHVHALCYAARNLTDGRITTGALRGLRGTVRQAATLVEAGVWEKASGDWQIHDYLKYNPSSSQVAEEREAATKRMQRKRSGNVRANN